MVTPPDRDGNIPDDILAAAKVARSDPYIQDGRRPGGGGTGIWNPVRAEGGQDCGAGNIFVATAKRMVFGLVDIDMIAGPSEILVVADRAAEPRLLAADMPESGGSMTSWPLRCLSATVWSLRKRQPRRLKSR